MDISPIWGLGTSKSGTLLGEPLGKLSTLSLDIVQMRCGGGGWNRKSKNKTKYSVQFFQIIQDSTFYSTREYFKEYYQLNHYQHHQNPNNHHPHHYYQLLTSEWCLEFNKVKILAITNQHWPCPRNAPNLEYRILATTKSLLTLAYIVIDIKTRPKELSV